MNSWEIFGHDWAVEMLQQHVAHNSLRHAYLFTGPDGVGRRTLALRLAQALNCEKPPAPGVPCRTCRTCKQIQAGTHPDLAILKREDEKRDLSIGQIRDIGKFLTYKPYIGAYKVLIIINFDDANIQAQHGLLKTLEEAPAFLIILLTAGNTEQLLPTIVSRCEIMRLRPLKLDSMQAFLNFNKVPSEKTSFLAHLADGRPGHALELNDNKKMIAFRNEKLDDLRMLISAKLRDRIRYTEKLVKDKDHFRATILIWISFWRDVLMKTSGSQVELTNIDRSEEIEKLSFRLDRSQVHAITEGLELAFDRLDRNVNPRLLAEVTLMDWPQVR